VLRALVVSCLLVPAIAAAQVEELENPGSVSAIQKRAFTMRHELDISVGVLPLDAFYVGLFAQVGYTAHFSDSFAWTIGRFAYSYAARTGLREKLERDFGVLPTAFEEVQYFFGSDIVWTPFHGKIAVTNGFVVHGEVFFILGATLFRFTNTFRPGINLGGGGRIVLTENVSIRLDVTDNVVIPVGGGATSFTNVMTTTLSLAINFGAPE
jgi:outer membrane beta-barrel protein